MASTGMDLGPWVRGERTDTGRPVYAESLYAFNHYGWAPQSALVTAEHKLIDSTTDELYHRSDAAEADNLAVTETTRLGELQAQIEALRAQLTPEQTADRVTMSAERMAQLEALGYLVTDLSLIHI